MKTGGQNEDSRKLCENRMVTTERRICTQLIFISRVCIHLGNAMQPVGPCTDNFTKLLIQLYVCLANLTKHFIARQKISPVTYKSTKFDQLVQTLGKRLPLKVYAMISYIEDNIFANEQDEDGNEDEAHRSKSKKPKNQKAKVMRDTKNIPKLILRIENFNKFVISLSKKTEHDLSKCLHLGTVRDFRIRTRELRDAIEKIRQNEEDDDDDEGDGSVEDTVDSDDEDDDDDMAEVSEAASVAATGSTSSIAGSTGSSINNSIIKEVQHDTSLRTSVMKNMNAINKRASKRKKLDADTVDDASENQQPQQRRKKRKENEPMETTESATTSTRRSSRRIPSK